MTRKIAARHEKDLKAMGVYKPYVSMEDDALCVESYPLMARVRNGAVDPEMGPTQWIKITDCTLPRMGLNAVVSTSSVFLGQDVLGRVAELLLAFHGPAYARDNEQRLAAMAVLALPPMQVHTSTETSAEAMRQR